MKYIILAMAILLAPACAIVSGYDPYYHPERGDGGQGEGGGGTGTGGGVAGTY